MKIIYLHQHFRTPSMGGGGTRSYEFAKRLVAHGHTVEMIAGWQAGSTLNTNESTTNEDGIHVHWIRCVYSNRMTFVRRLWAFAHFAFAAAVKASSLNGDLVFATSTPLTIALPAIYASLRRRIPMVFEVRDLWPDAPIGMGILRSRILIAAARWLEWAAYHWASHVIALSPAMREGVLRRGIPEEKVSMIPNAADLDVFSPDADSTETRKEMGWTGKFVCIHLGAMGPINGLGFVVDCAIELRSRGIDDVVFLFHGDGRDRRDLEERCRSEQLNNVIFSGPSDKRTAARMLAASDASLTTIKNVPALNACSPNKFFDTLAAGKPVLTNVSGWLAHLTQSERLGFFIEPDNVNDFANQVIFLRDHPEVCAEFGRNARRVAESQFARDKLAQEFENVLVANAPQPTLCQSSAASSNGD